MYYKINKFKFVIQKPEGFGFIIGLGYSNELKSIWFNIGIIKIIFEIGIKIKNVW